MEAYAVVERIAMTVYGDVVLAESGHGLVAIKRSDVACAAQHVTFQNQTIATTKDVEMERVVYEHLHRLGGHRNIVAYVESFQHFGYHHFVLEHSCQGSLRGKTLNNRQLTAMLTQMLEAVCFLHANGIVHGDIQPSNVLVFGTSFKLCDFASAVMLSRCNPEEAALLRLKDLQALGSLASSFLSADIDKQCTLPILHLLDAIAGLADKRQCRPSFMCLTSPEAFSSMLCSI